MKMVFSERVKDVFVVVLREKYGAIENSRGWKGKFWIFWGLNNKGKKKTPEGIGNESSMKVVII